MKNKFTIIYFIFALIFCLQSCKNNATSPSDTGSARVSFTIQFELNGTGDTLRFLAKPNFKVKVTFIKVTFPSGDTGSASNLNFNWDSVSNNILGYTSPATGLYKFQFKGTRNFDNLAFDTTAQQTYSGGGTVVNFTVKHFVNAANDTLFFYGAPNVNIKLDSIISTYPDNQSYSGFYNGFAWKNTDSLIFDYYSPSVTGTYKFRFTGKTDPGNIAFNVTVSHVFPMDFNNSKMNYYQREKFKLLK